MTTARKKTTLRKAVTVAATIPAEPVPPLWWESATAKMVAAALAVVLAWSVAAAVGYSPWPVVRPWLNGEDGLLLKSFGYKMAFGLLALTMWWQFQVSRLRSNGLNFRKDLWPEILAGNTAVANWLGYGMLASAVLLGMVL